MTQTHHAQLKNKTIFFFIRFIENFSRVNDQNVNFLNETSQDRDALQQLKKTKIKSEFIDLRTLTQMK